MPFPMKMQSADAGDPGMDRDRKLAKYVVFNFSVVAGYVLIWQPGPLGPRLIVAGVILAVTGFIAWRWWIRAEGP